jgi:hypothetical protein
LAQNLVTCGGGTYNAISSHYLGLKQAFYTFDYGQDGAHILRSLEESPLDFAALGRASKHELACIQRLKDPDSDSIVFICAGLGSGATYGAVEYLVRNWNQLRRKYRNREFGVCLSYATAEPDGIPTVTPRIIHQVVRPKGRR